MLSQDGDSLLIERWDYTVVLLTRQNGLIIKNEFPDEIKAREAVELASWRIKERIGRPNGTLPRV